jgi:hypothetical protein
LITPEPPGANCVAGGQRIDVGVDSDYSGVLESSEIQHTAYVCDGVKGPQGDAGADGISTLVTSTPELPGKNCASGGVKISIGPDTDRDGVLSAGEVASVSYVCNGNSAVPRVAHFDDDGCDPSLVPDAEHAIFVDGTDGDDSVGTGLAGAPVKSLAVGIGLASALGKTSVYLNEGTYAAPPALAAGTVVYIEGAWKRVSSDGWQRDCVPAARESTVIAGPIVAKGSNAGLRSLTVHAEGKASNVAVSALAGGLSIRDAVLSAGPALMGAVGAPGFRGSSGSGTAATCADAAPGSPGPNGQSSKGATFAADGTFVPGNGSSGSFFSGSGHAGVAGPATVCKTSISCDTVTRTVTGPECGMHQCNPQSCNPHTCNCVFLVGCDTCYDTCYDSCPNTCQVFDHCALSSYQSSAVQGYCGNGGQGGGPGAGGGGGGASVALEVISGASVNLVASALIADNGGDGAVGGPGGPGGTGAPGQSATCTDYNCPASSCSVFETSTQLTSAPGGTGGVGATGASGGSGAGGPSFGLVKLGTAAVTMDASTQINIGLGGKGAPGATDGPAILVFTAP